MLSAKLDNEETHQGVLKPNSSYPPVLDRDLQDKPQPRKPSRIRIIWSALRIKSTSMQNLDLLRSNNQLASKLFTRASICSFLVLCGKGKVKMRAAGYDSVLMNAYVGISWKVTQKVMSLPTQIGTFQKQLIKNGCEPFDSWCPLRNQNSLKIWRISTL